MAWQKELALISLLSISFAPIASHAITPWSESADSSNSPLAPILKEQRATWNEVKSIEDEKDAVLANIDRVLKEKNERIFDYQKLIHKLEKKLRSQELSFKDKLVGEYEKREISGLIEAKDEEIQKLQGQVSKLDLQVEAMKKQFKRQDTLFRYQLTQLKKNYQKAFESIASGDVEVPGNMAMKLTSYQIQIDKFLDKGLTSMGETSTASLGKRLESQEKTVQGLLQTNRDLVAQLRAVETENAELKTEIQGLNEKVVAANQESASWKRVANELERSLEQTQRKLEIATVTFEGERAELLEKMTAMQSAPSENGVARAPASVGTQTVTLTGHEQVVKAYRGVSQKLALANFEWAPELNMGNVAIKIKESFYFAKDSSVLTEMSKDRLHTLMEIYSQEIFGDEELREQVESIEFVGHSSPWFQGEVISPTLKYPEAYQYNMKLSIDRAREVVSYVFDGDFIDFPYKEDFRSKVKVSGMGHASPLVLRMPASEAKANGCAPYDCERSRRLDIIVHFKSKTL